MTGLKEKRKRAKCVSKSKDGSTPNSTRIQLRRSRATVPPGERSAALDGQMPRVPSVACYVGLQTGRLQSPCRNSSQVEPDLSRNLRRDTLESIHRKLDIAVLNKSQNIQNYNSPLESEDILLIPCGDEGGLLITENRHDFLKTGSEGDAVNSAPFIKNHTSSESPETFLEVDPIRLDPQENEAAERRHQLIKPIEAFHEDSAVNHEAIEAIEAQNRSGMSYDGAHDGTSASFFEDQEVSSDKEQISSSTVFSQFAPRAPAFLSSRSKIINEPSILELEEFFEEQDKRSQIAFMTRYNFDPVNEVPLAGRFDWVRVHQ